MINTGGDVTRGRWYNVSHLHRSKSPARVHTDTKVTDPRGSLTLYHCHHLTHIKDSKQRAWSARCRLPLSSWSRRHNENHLKTSSNHMRTNSDQLKLYMRPGSPAQANWEREQQPMTVCLSWKSRIEEMRWRLEITAPSGGHIHIYWLLSHTVLGFYF